MRFHVFKRPDGTLLFATEEHEANRAAGQKSGGLDRARSLDNQRGITAVVECPSAELPGIQMCSEDDHFVRLFVAANFADNVLLFNRSANLVGAMNSYFHASRICGNRSRQIHSVF